MLDASTVKKRISKSFALWDDLVSSLNDAHLSSKLRDLPSNEIGQQLWCVVGARESYLKALREGQWQGFSCSLKETKSQQEVLSAFKRSRAHFEEWFAVESTLSETQQDLLFSLIEHEAQHQGQLIRYLYGIKAVIPPSWKQRYHLD